MDTITLRFTTKWPYNPVSLAVARLGGSRDWSHVIAIVDNMAYEATMLYFQDGNILRPRSGVRKVTVDVAIHGVKAYRDMNVPVASLQDSIAWAQQMEGKKYDFAGALGLPLLSSDDWADDSKWWCSEFVFMMLGVGGNWVLDPAEKKRVTPNDLFQCNYKKSAIVRL